jgi:hypothetical protein
VREPYRPGQQDDGADPTMEQGGDAQGQGDAAEYADKTELGAGEEGDHACDDVVLLLVSEKLPSSPIAAHRTTRNPMMARPLGALLQAASRPLTFFARV